MTPVVGQLLLITIAWLGLCGLVMFAALSHLASTKDRP
jgi:hypothetical protein